MVWQGILKVCEMTVNLVTAAALFVCGSFGAYALWDNGQVLTSAADVRAELLQWKPTPETAEETPDNSACFQQLRKINPDVCGWIAMDGTGIDFPILQGENNLSYISRDVFGSFSLAGSIFLDSRDDPAFGESYALLYGHHMADGNMFGDLDRYMEEDFFQKNRTGVLILPEKTFALEIVACMTVSASDRNIFDPEYVRANSGALISYARDHAVCFREDLTESGKWIALTTCSSEFTDARTVVLARMQPMTIGEQEE